MGEGDIICKGEGGMPAADFPPEGWDQEMTAWSK